MLDRKEKENFLELAYLVANGDKVTEINTECVIKLYRDEMGLYEESYKLKGENFYTVIDYLKNIEQQKKNIIYFEIISLMVSDKRFDPREKDLASKIRNLWNITSEKHFEFLQWLYDKQKLDKQAERLIFK